MTTTLRVIVDDVIAPTLGGNARYTEELTRALIETTPFGCEVTGVVASSPDADYERLARLLPGMADLFKSALARRELQLAWQHGITKLPGSGMVHAPSLLAPLSRHDRVDDPTDQIVVTLPDVSAWTQPELIGSRRAAWMKAMVKRAQRYADAVVVPTHAIAHALDEVAAFGERVRVIGGGVSAKMNVPVDADERASRLGLPDRYILSVGTIEERKGLVPLVQSLASEQDAGIPLLIVGASGWGDLDIEQAAAEAGVAAGRVRVLGYVPDTDLSVLFDRATVFAYPSLSDGFALPMLEALHFGTPVVHSDEESVAELAADAGVTAEIGDDDGFPDRLAAAITSVVTDAALAERLRYSGIDRAGAFAWNDTAQQIWQLHADL